jgi:DNA polymerase III subunit epsilon
MFFDFFNKKTSNNYPEYWTNYIQTFKTPLHKDTLLENVRFVVLDTETTGVNPRKDRILSIAAVSIQNNQLEVSDSFEYFIENDNQNPESIHIHGILPKGKEEKVSEENALKSFLEYCGNSIIIGHHIGFDMAILNQIAQKLVADELRNQTIDTASLSIRIEKNRSDYYFTPQDYSLDALTSRYQVQTNDRHTAAGDAYMTAILFLKLLALLQKKGVDTLGKLMKGMR